MSEHWYDTEGSPAYTYRNAKGEKKNTTLREARKFNYWPSVTTVMGMAAAPGLDYYKQQQLLKAAWDEGTLPDMTYEIWSRRVIEQSKKHAKNAANRGTEIHDLLERHYKEEMALSFSEEDSSNDIWIAGEAVAFLNKNFPDAQWIAEASFYSPLGFGGKVDLHDPINKIVLDFKTKDTDDIKKMIAYDGHHMQTAAYAVGLSEYGYYEDDFDGADPENWKRYNLFISTQVPGLLNLTESKDFNREWGMFEALLNYWQLSNKYSPEGL